MARDRKLGEERRYVELVREASAWVEVAGTPGQTFGSRSCDKRRLPLPNGGRGNEAMLSQFRKFDESSSAPPESVEPVSSKITSSISCTNSIFPKILRARLFQRLISSTVPQNRNSKRIIITDLIVLENLTIAAFALTHSHPFLVIFILAITYSDVRSGS